MPNASTPSFSVHAIVTDFRQALRCVPPSILQGVMAAAMLCALAPVAIAAMQQAPAVAAVKAAPVASLIASVAGTRSRCPGCGFVESIRPIGPDGVVPAGFEFTVRMRDGTLRTSSDSSAGRWLVGDRIILVGGVKAAAL